MKRKLLAFIIFLVPILLMSCSLEQFLDENSGYDCEKTVIESIELNGDNISTEDFVGHRNHGWSTQLLSNEVTGNLNIKLADGWELSNLSCAVENNTKLTSDNTIKTESDATDIELDKPFMLGKNYSDIYIEVHNPSADTYGKYELSLYAYDELIINWKEMIPNKTKFIFNRDYYESENKVNGDFVMAYVSTPNDTNVSLFTTKKDFVTHVNDYVLPFTFDPWNTYKEQGDKLIVYMAKGNGINSVRTENPGDGTWIKIVRN
ncbi:MAG: hypothetical protein RR313_07305 [Anaerovoracaceae bacterium]